MHVRTYDQTTSIQSVPMKELMKKARESLSREYNVSPDELLYLGVWDTGIGKIFLTFNIMSEEHTRYKSTVVYNVE